MDRKFYRKPTITEVRSLPLRFLLHRKELGKFRRFLFWFLLTVEKVPTLFPGVTEPEDSFWKP
jgi:hypothetical protein